MSYQDHFVQVDGLKTRCIDAHSLPKTALIGHSQAGDMAVANDRETDHDDAQQTA